MAAASISKLRQSLRGAAGIARSLRIYYGSWSHRRGMLALYKRYFTSGDLVFDIGSHVGDRAGAFARLGARVIAVEPQPAAFRWLKIRYGRNPLITLIRAAVSSTPGELTMHLNLANPTISTASTDFINATDGAPGWEGQSWDETVSVPATTLDLLIAEHGMPAFVKIDVEGFELNVLQGLSQTVPALSFEFTTIQRGVALDCIARLCELGDYRFNLSLGESHHLEFEQPLDGKAISDHIMALPANANSGDIYAISNAASPGDI